MPRTLAFGTGALFVALDERHRIRELTFPHVGLYNHLSGEPIRMGVWVDGRFSWCDSEAWQVSQHFDPVSNTGSAELVNQELQLSLHCEDQAEAVSYFRKIAIRNLSGEAREVRLYFTHPLTIDESDIGDTAMYMPALDAMVHYKGKRAIAFFARTESAGIAEYAAGLRVFGGAQGTWLEAESGKLSMNPIAQGTADSTMGVHVTLPPYGGALAEYGFHCADSIDGLSESFSIESPELAKLRPSLGSGAGGLLEAPDSVRQQTLTSVRFLAAHLDFAPDRFASRTSPGGALLAAIDSDIMETNRANYACFWPRDGAFCMEAFDLVGDPGPARRMFTFCAELLSPQRPFFLQKYRPDGALGATWHPWTFEGSPETPMQQDETALVLWAAGKHVRRFGADGFEELWNRLIRPAADFLCAFRDADSGLPRASYDLWEERRGIHAFTCGAAIAGLRGAASIGKALGIDAAASFSQMAESLTASVREHFVSSDSGVWARCLIPEPDGGLTRDQTPDSSMLHLLLLGVLLPGDLAAASLVDRIDRSLTVEGPIGGVARYSGDYYFRRSHETPGNPWIITTLWLARCLHRLNRTPEDRLRAKRLLNWAMERAAPTGSLPEQVDPITGAPLSVAPLAWSHAEFIVAAHELYGTVTHAS